MEKKLCILVLGIFVSASLYGQSDVKLENRKDSVSYYIGVSMLDGVKSFGITVDHEMVLKGYMSAADGKVSMSATEANRYIQTVIRSVHMADYEKRKEMGRKFLEKNRQVPGIIETESGLQYRIVAEGEGRKPKANDYVQVEFTGYLLDGTIFDSSEERGGKAIFSLQQVVPGWQEALKLMSVGSEFVLYIPPELGFGERGSGDEVDPGSTLMYEVKLLDITDFSN